MLRIASAANTPTRFCSSRSSLATVSRPFSSRRRRVRRRRINLLLQFQGMIAEYERAQILERSRRGKRHRARQGQISVLSGAPYGYRYVRKSDETAAFYQIIEAEADVVRLVYERYTVEHLSIGAITRLLNEQGVPTRKRISRWERSTVWAMLRNPAYKGTACFGKTEIRPRQRVTRPLRMRGGVAKRNSANHERPRTEWIEIPVPAIISEETFALAQELLTANKTHAPRRTIEPSICQGMVSCSKCGYALYRTSTRSSARKIHYYRCLGSDAWRHLNGPVCNNRPVRQDLLDQVVWNEIVRLLESSSPHRRGAQPQTGGCAERCTDKATARDPAARSDAGAQEHGAFDDGVSGGSPVARRTAKSDAGSASTRTGRTCRVAVDRRPRRKIALPICAWQRRSRRFSVACAPRPRHSTSWNVNGSSDYWSRRYWSRRRDHHSPFDPRHSQPTSRRGTAEIQPHRGGQKAKVIFCVQGVASPLLANIYLHHVYDQWVHQWRQRCATGDVIVVRYADDNIVGFEHRHEAEQFLADLKARLARFGLNLHPDKTRLIEFGRSAIANRHARGLGKPETFDFLGFSVLQRHIERRSA